MATTRLMPLHNRKDRTTKNSIDPGIPCQPPGTSHDRGLAAGRFAEDLRFDQGNVIDSINEKSAPQVGADFIC